MQKSGKFTRMHYRLADLVLRAFANHVVSQLNTFNIYSVHTNICFALTYLEVIVVMPLLLLVVVYLWKLQI